MYDLRGVVKVEYHSPVNALPMFQLKAGSQQVVVSLSSKLSCGSLHLHPKIVGEGREASKDQYPPVWQGTDGEHSHWTLDGLIVNRSLRSTIWNARK